MGSTGNESDPAAVLNQVKSSHMPKSLRATLRGPPWTSSGWSATAPGFVFWFALRHPEGAQVFCGEDIISASRQLAETKDASAVQAHLLAHRYTVERESIKDRLTWHTAVVLEWSHGC